MDWSLCAICGEKSEDVLVRTVDYCSVFERLKVLKDKKPEIVECLKSPSLSDLQDNRTTYHKICYRKLSLDRVHLLPRIPVELPSSSGESSRVSRSFQDAATQGCIFGDKTKLLSEKLHDVQTLTLAQELKEKAKKLADTQLSD
jgi:hypothetical protein